MKEREFDIIVIGGGPAGYISAIKAAQLGARTALIEKDVVGGTCLNRGCIPTKYYLKSAELIYELQSAVKRGVVIQDSSFSMDMTTAVAGKNTVVKKLTNGVKSLLKANDVTILAGTGKAVSSHVVEINGQEQKTCKAVILAGGSKVSRIPIPGVEHQRILTSDDILDIKEIPKSLIIIGGGVIGVEMAMIFNAFGSDVTIVELENKILPLMDKEISEQLTRSIRKRGITILTGTKISRIGDRSDLVEISLADESVIQAEYALLSIGREADLSCADIEGLQVDRGKIVVNDRMQTTVPGVFAVGDLNGKKMLAHAAFSMGKTAAINAVNLIKGISERERVELSYVPSIVYSIPEVGSVGLSEVEAKKKYDIAVGKFPLSANGRALASGAPEGFIKVLADKRYGQIVGVHMVGYHTSEVINEAAALMAMEITVHEVAHMIHGHPTISEAFMEAAADCVHSSMHLPPL